MTSDEILAELQPIFKNVLDQPDLVITRDSSGHNVEDWDSLSQINLVMAIEKRFQIKFALSQLKELQNVGDMVDLIQKKLAEK